MSILRDEAGVEGIPLKLIIVLVIVAITVPVAWKGLESYDRSQTETNLVMEIDFLAANIKQVYLNGMGNARDVEVDFSDGFVTSVERIEIGDSEDGVWSSIRYKMAHKNSQFVLIKNPNIPIAHVSQEDAEPLVVGPGRHTIHLETKKGYDFDSDGTEDIYVEVSRVA
jgi:hypothetical protein